MLLRLGRVAADARARAADDGLVPRRCAELLVAEVKAKAIGANERCRKLDRRVVRTEGGLDGALRGAAIGVRGEACVVGEGGGEQAGCRLRRATGYRLRATTGYGRQATGYGQKREDGDSQPVARRPIWVAWVSRK